MNPDLGLDLVACWIGDPELGLDVDIVVGVVVDLDAVRGDGCERI